MAPLAAREKQIYAARPNTTSSTQELRWELRRVQRADEKRGSFHINMDAVID